jgi:hypothetical protein
VQVAIRLVYLVNVLAPVFQESLAAQEPAMPRFGPERGGRVSHASGDEEKVRGFGIGLVTLDFILRIIVRCMTRMPFVIDVLPEDFDDPPGDVTGFRIPGHVIADFELLDHDGSFPVTATRPRWRLPPAKAVSQWSRRILSTGGVESILDSAHQ